MSVLRRALRIPHEERSTGVTWLPSSGRRAPDIPDGYGIPGYGAWDAGMVWRSGTGAPVTNESAARLSAVYGCWRLLSDVVSTMPLDTFIRKGGVRQPYRPRPTYLDFQPPQSGKIAYLCQVVMSLLSDGNAFVATPRDELGVPLDLIPLDPTKVDVCYDKNRKDRNGRPDRLFYAAGGDEYGYLDIMHIPGLMFPGALRGMSPLAAAREVIEAGLQAQRYGRDFTSNMAVPPAVIKVPSQGGDPVVERERARKVGELWNATYGGSNAGKIGVLVGGAELQTIAINQKDAQWLESKQFTVTEIARFYGVPPHLIADASNSTSWGSGLAEQNQAFGSFTIQPTTERVEEAHGRLLTTHGLGDVFVKLNIDAKLRAAPLQRAQTVDIQIKNQSMTINEARALEDRPPVPWGDDFTAAAPDVAAGDSEARGIAETIQKIYLGVGSVVTADEAREIVNRDGAGLTGPAPGGNP